MTYSKRRARTPAFGTPLPFLWNGGGNAGSGFRDDLQYAASMLAALGRRRARLPSALPCRSCGMAAVTRVRAFEMTYSGSQALLAIPTERLRRPLPAPAVQSRSHGNLRLRQDGRVAITIQKQNPLQRGCRGFSFWSLARACPALSGMTYSHMGRSGAPGPHVKSGSPHGRVVHIQR